MSMTKKQIAKSVKTLIVLLQSMRDQQVVITLRNDTIVRGTIIRVDDCMNIELENATFEEDLFYKTGGEKDKDGRLAASSTAGLSESGGDYFVIKGSRIRHIALDSESDLLACAKMEIEQIRARNRPWSKRDIVQTNKQ